MQGVSTGRGSGMMSARALAQGLGWVSIGLGLAEMLAPRTMCRVTGLDDDKATMLRVYGMREIANGVGVLAAEDKAGWLWGRVGGDGLDLATLATDLRSDNRGRSRVVGSMAAVIGITLLDAFAAVSCGRERRQERLTSSSYAQAYGRRRGLPRAPAAMRGTAADAPVGDDMRQPPALQPWGDGPRTVSERTGIALPSTRGNGNAAPDVAQRYSAAMTQTGQSSPSAVGGAPAMRSPTADSLASPARG